jgi:alpha(1,3/1,4) fucosyltransferase
MKPELRIKFSDFWAHFDERKNFIYENLSEHYQLVFSDNPDLLVFASYTHHHTRYNCLKLFYSGENERINWNACDFAIGMDYLEDERYYRLPNWIWYDDVTKLVQDKKDPKKLLEAKTGFCNMVVSNPYSTRRIDFFHELSRYKQVDSGGRYLNNVGGPVADKKEFIKQYKFTIAFENSRYPGYCTEKIFEPLLVNSVPLYWGDPFVNQVFNKDAFINCGDFASHREAIEFIREVDNNDALYLKFLSASAFVDNQVPVNFRKHNIRIFLLRVAAAVGKVQPVSTTYRKKMYYLFLQKERLVKRVSGIIPIRKNFR